MKDIIKAAIDGGYMKGEVETNNDGLWLSNSDRTLHQSDIVIDPLFWQSLGNAMCWDECENDSDWGDEESTEECRDEWYFKAMKFHEINLTEGWDNAVEWLNNLVNNK